MDIDQKLIKFSHKRAVLAGKFLEIYNYERPFSYNWPPLVSNRTSSRRKIERRADNLTTTRARLVRTIRANTSAEFLPKFVTFTFAENVTNLDTANRIWRKFRAELVHALGRQKYVAVIEFQKRGAIHYHVLFFAMPYRNDLKTILSRLWRWGFIKIKALNDIQDVALYVSKYLSKETHDVRLAGRKAYFTSRGLQRATELRDEQAVRALTDEVLKRNVELAAESYVSARFGNVVVLKGKL